jgi:hypothetical protein
MPVQKPKESISSLKRKLAGVTRQNRELSNEILSMALTIDNLRGEVIALRDASQTIEHHPEWTAINPIHDPRTCGKSHPGELTETVRDENGRIISHEHIILPESAYEQGALF